MVKRLHIFIDGIEHKHCSACKKDKPLQEYTKEKNRWDGHALYCKDCHNTKKHIWNAAHQSEQQAYFKAYHLAHQAKKCAMSSTWYYANKEQALARAKEYALAHPEKAEWTRQWCEAHPEQVRQMKRQGKLRRRTRMAALPFQWTAAEETFTYQYWQYACAVCGIERGPYLTIALDHWIPIASPVCPGTVAGNMVPLCHATKGAALATPACNQKKGKKDPTAWLIEHIGKSKAEAKLREIEDFFVQARLITERATICHVG